MVARPDPCGCSRFSALPIEMRSAYAPRHASDPHSADCRRRQSSSPRRVCHDASGSGPQRRAIRRTWTTTRRPHRHRAPRPPSTSPQPVAWSQLESSGPSARGPHLDVDPATGRVPLRGRTVPPSSATPATISPLMLAELAPEARRRDVRTRGSLVEVRARDLRGRRASPRSWLPCGLRPGREPLERVAATVASRHLATAPAPPSAPTVRYGSHGFARTRWLLDPAHTTSYRTGPMIRRRRLAPVDRCLHGCWWTEDGSSPLRGQTGPTALDDR